MEIEAGRGATGSVRARALRRISSHTVARLGAMLPVDDRTLPVARAVIDGTLRAVAPPLRGTGVREIAEGSVRGEWVYGPRVSRGDAVVLYVHGGGFVAGSARSFRGVSSRLSQATGLPVFAMDYRLAPEHRSPAAVEDTAGAYRWLLNRGYSPSSIVVAGDSAGGYLAADLVIANARNGLPAPAGLLLFSPMVGPGRSRHGRDGLLSPALMRAAVSLFTDSPLTLPLAPGQALPPTLIQVSDSELLTADAIDFADRLRALGTDCELQVWPGQIHVFQALAALVPESRRAFAAVGDFVASRLDSVAAQAV
ncbi:alpha/beta hydrolase [Nocardia mexicana]|uniref:Acetyl esterase/lipase n=1 Tax=Nocardia mexicana TaxID=279262 RepID=A0A370GMK0_9NOCA|nr:alpha/beta hydrolase [Nocardia mexicana]RDI44958.1 acetyl esterase/lipase [Nocardia mexicana]